MHYSYKNVEKAQKHFLTGHSKSLLNPTWIYANLDFGLCQTITNQYYIGVPDNIP